ncbi:DUF2626 domain-containing protein [Halalkalibacillus sediminis]|uniref:DUF2626 domain-containing protein n=1 Tax=Halalkalibacillus sediminis TaxID=2018042 RepID=A0A2I0QXA7_9BACI|nr:DUF2626 domain-containing protein [Halalkalibacillus sediminis]PKR78986.1 DUF2626 domain-containing protein [Halalkalibacillus sediminis]
MARMFRVMSFWTAIFTAMFYAGGMMPMAMLFLAQTVFFLGIGYLNLSERLYMYVFGAYLTLFMIGFTYYTTFLLEPSFAH